MVGCNPNIFDYTESLQLVDILASTLSRSKHELTLFEATNSLVQLSALGEDVCIRLVKKHMLWGTLVLNLAEQNDYVVQATLELLNNLSLTDYLQTNYPGFNTSERECKIVKYLLQKYHEEKIQPLLGKKNIIESGLIGKYNTVLQKLALLVGFPLFLGIAEELVVILFFYVILL